MKVISWNINGLRAIHRRGFLEWLDSVDADIVCLQEIKAQVNQLPVELIQPKQHITYFNPSNKKGYSGVAVYTKKQPFKVYYTLGFERFDQEGRLLRVDFNQLTILNLYLPHGGRGKENLSFKINVYKYLFQYIEELKQYIPHVLLIGDFNIAHKEIDLARPKQNRNNVMFTQAERHVLDQLLGIGFIDTYRKFNQEGGNYTWWPYIANARKRNLGWRIDYAFASHTLSSCVRNSLILPEIAGSDHCPIVIEIGDESVD